MIYWWVLAGILVGSLWLEAGLRTHVLRRWRRLLLTIAGTLIAFGAWDAYAITSGHWHFHELSGLHVGPVPLEELAFFMVVPLAAILTFEAVRAVKSWPAGDER